MAVGKGEVLLKLLLLLSILRPLQGSKLIKEASHFATLPTEQYDYIVVGGGTAGCPLAATLSQNNKNYKILLLERGGSPHGNWNISRLENFHITLLDMSPTSPSQAFISTDGVINTRARVLGGGSCINAGFYSRASPRFVEKVGWEGKLVNESYRWVEDKIVYWPKVTPWNAAFRDGLVAAGVSPFNGFTYDHLPGTKVGGTIFDENGFRHTAADLLAAANPNNLRVFIHATTQKIIFHTQERRQPKAVGVLFKDENGDLHQAFLKDNPESEIILSAGALGSPQMLLLSGIGRKEELEKFKIPMILHNEHVGKGMADNPMNTIFIPTKKPMRQSLIETVGITKHGSFLEASCGFSQSSDSVQCHHGILSGEIGQLSTIPPSQRSLEAMKEYARNKQNLPREVFQGGFILSKVDGPLSSGHLNLQNTDAGYNPNVTFNYFSHPHDLKRCVYGIRTAEKLVQTNHFANFSIDNYVTEKGNVMERILNMSVKANVNLIPKHTNDTASLEQYCKDTVLTIWHYHGGCHVGRVVDKDYKVIGVTRLRIVDGSVFPSSPGTNPQATVLMMGRYMGTKILRKRLGAA
ncbi:hypothetical protein LUZ60_013576 [Juncus effusus]|nr:hypothetical protein LUZ60_013576 [Juncus effusus]